MSTDNFAPLSHDDRARIFLPAELPQDHSSTFTTSICIGIGILVFLILFALFVPLLSPYTYNETCLINKNLPPCATHFFGTDDLGRDLCTRIAMALRLSLLIGITAAILDMTIGVAWGAIAGYFGGIIDVIFMRIADFIYCVPYLLSVILITSIIGSGITSILCAMAIVGWIQMARVTRATVMHMKELEYVQAAIALGMTPPRIFFRHILPNISGPLLAMLMLTIPHAIFTEAFLSFLGIGIQPPIASLGSMTSDALSALRFYPWRLFIPALTITFAILAFNLIGDGLRDMFDPKGKKALHAA